MFGACLCGSKSDLEACLVNGYWFDLILHNTSKPGEPVDDGFRVIRIMYR